jgi:hypothetical protein
MSDKNPSTPRLLTVNQFAEEHKFITFAGLRFAIFNSSTNGMQKQKVIKRMGRKILLDEQAFFSWINERSEGSHA